MTRPSLLGPITLTKSWVVVNQVHHDILITYRHDFARYKGRLDMALFDTVFACIPKYVGSKIVYRQVSQDHQAASIKKVMQLIATARVIHMIHATNANGVPLGAEIREKFNKIICLDVGLMNASLGISFAHLKNPADIDFINHGAIAEQLETRYLDFSRHSTLLRHLTLSPCQLQLKLPFGSFVKETEALVIAQERISIQLPPLYTSHWPDFLLPHL